MVTLQALVFRYPMPVIWLGRHIGQLYSKWQTGYHVYD